MQFFKLLAAPLAILLGALTACGGGGGGATTTAKVPISVSMSTVISGSGNTAVGTVFLAGASSSEVFGLNMDVTTPAGVSIASAIQSGVAINAATPQVNQKLVIMASGTGFGSGEVMKMNFINVSSAAVPADFGISLSKVFGAGGVQIQ